MTEVTEEALKAIHETHDEVIRISTLLGNGEKGLCADVRSHNQRLGRVELLLAFLLGSGVLTGGIYGLLKLLA